MGKNNPLNPSLIIATYNWPEALELVLESVSKQSLPPSELIIADDGSSDRTKKVIDAFRATVPYPVKHIWHEDNGYRLSSIRNKAFLACKGDYIIQADGDIIFHPDFIFDHVSSVAKGYFIIGGRINLTQEQTGRALAGEPIKSLDGFGFSKRIKKSRIPIISPFMYGYKSGNFMYGFGANISFWTEDVRKVNGFDEDFTGWGLEDSDFISRMMNLGLKKRYLRFRAICYHLWHSSRKRDDVFDKNRIILGKNVHSKRIFCENGMVKKS